MGDLRDNLVKICERLDQNDELLDVLVAIIHSNHNESVPDDLANMFENTLDDLVGYDFFGTEGQCDPRGDMRNGTFTVWDIEEK